MDSSTLNEEVPDPDADLLPCEVALSIHHIAQKIFTPLSTQDLFNCRQVSKNWKRYSTPFLQPRIIKLNIYGFNRGSATAPSKTQELGSKSISIQELLKLLNEVNPPGTFPCTKFHLQGGNLFNEKREFFLTNYGMWIDHLSLTIQQHSRKTIEIAAVTKQIKNILTMQTPNTKYFSLSLPPTSSKSSENTKTNISPDCSPLLQSDPEFQQIQQCIRSGNIVFNTKLKFLELSVNTNATLLETIIQCCPNLQDVKLNVQNCDMYIFPVNRLHLLKSLEFYPCEGLIDKLEKLAEFAIVKQTEEGPIQKLLLRELNLNFEDGEWGSEFSSIAFEQRVVSILHDIFQCSASSLEEISWVGKFLFNGIQFPEVMPRVHSIKFTNTHFYEPDYMNKCSNGLMRFFPRRFSCATMFPNLQCVYFYSKDIWYAEFRLFLKCLKFDPVPTVKKVFICWEGRKPVTDSDLKWIRRLFPNATVSYSREESVDE